MKCRWFQLKSEQRGGRVFPGWNEGRIYFPPTYKYSNNSDKYAGEDMNQKEKKRTPAWYGNLKHIVALQIVLPDYVQLEKKTQ